jgi:hypothetical protein
MPHNKQWYIRSWHGSYELKTGTASAPGAGDGKRLSFLLTSFLRRDPQVMSTLIDIYATLSGHDFYPAHSTAPFAAQDLKRIAEELQSQAKAGFLHINSTNPLKKLYVKDIPQEIPKPLEEEPEQVIPVASEKTTTQGAAATSKETTGQDTVATSNDSSGQGTAAASDDTSEQNTAVTTDSSWYELTLKDEIEGLISGANVEFIVGSDTKTIPTGSNGAARYTGGTAEDAHAVIKYPDSHAIPIPEPETTWFEVNVSDKDGKPIPQSKAIFYIGNKPYEVACDVNGKARLENVEAEKAVVKVLYPAHAQK